METILRPPQWPTAFSRFVTWCLMWDPRNRPTSMEAMQHEYFFDAVDPLRPKSSASRALNKKHMSVDGKTQRENIDGSTSTSRPSWFRKSLIKDSHPFVHTPPAEQSVKPLTPKLPVSPHPAPAHSKIDAPEPSHSSRFRPFANKRATWTHGTSSNAAPMPILPSIRPISPFSATVNAQAHSDGAVHMRPEAGQHAPDVKPGKKVGRQLSVQSQSNHYADLHRQDAERALSGQRLPQSPSPEQKEGFFSHLRKRARRFSGKPQGSTSPGPEDTEAGTGCSPWQSNRNSMIIDSNMDTILKKSFSDVDKALQSATYGAQPLSPPPEPVPSTQLMPPFNSADITPQRHPSLSKSVSNPALDSPSLSGSGGPISSRTRRALHKSTHPSHIYDTPDEEDELLQEALNSAQNARKTLERRSRTEEQYYQKSRSTADNTPQPKVPPPNGIPTVNSYPTPSPFAKRNGILFDQRIMDEPVTTLNIGNTRPRDVNPRWPTPPYEENEWAASAAASIFAASSVY